MCLQINFGFWNFWTACIRSSNSSTPVRMYSSLVLDNTMFATYIVGSHEYHVPWVSHVHTTATQDGCVTQHYRCCCGPCRYLLCNISVSVSSWPLLRCHDDSNIIISAFINKFPDYIVWGEIWECVPSIIMVVLKKVSKLSNKI